jgi:glycerophosphoryl diester phosphodiesterase
VEPAAGSHSSAFDDFEIAVTPAYGLHRGPSMRMPTILAHRGNIDGPSRLGENRLPQIESALARGWGLEVDIRRASDGRFYLSHDRLASADDGLAAEAFSAALRQAPGATVALNLKELGYERALVRWLRREGVVAQTVLFDMELIEPHAGETAALFRALDPDVQIAARVSDRGELVDRALEIDAASVIWLDEFEGPWATEHDVRRLVSAGRRVYAVSPDLHGAPLDRARRRWADFRAWQVDAICTDYPAELETMLAGRAVGVPA